MSSQNVPVLSLTLTHWLEFLRASSLLNVATHPKNPSSYSFDPTMTFGGAGSALNFSASASLYEAIEAAKEENEEDFEDLWYDVIFPVLYKLTFISRLNAELLGDLDNDSSHAVLGKITKRALLSFNPAATAVPLVWIPENVRYAMIDFLLENIFRSESFQENVTSTFLEKILEIANLYFLCLIPYPDLYAVKPFCLGLMDAWAPYNGLTFPPNSILSVSVGRTGPTFNIRGVVVLSDMDNLAGSQIQTGAAGGYETIAGSYRSFLTSTGQVFFYPSPPYLKYSILEDSVSESLDSEKPSSRNPKRINPFSLQEKVLKFYSCIPILDRVAQYIFITNQIGSRNLSIVTPFRGDVAPGSTVKVFVGDPEFVPEVPSTVLTGTVVSVRYTFSAVPSVPLSTYTIVGWRTPFESLHADYSIPTHPIYQVHFIGGWHLPWLII